MYAFTYHRPTSLAALKGLLGSEEFSLLGWRPDAAADDEAAAGEP